MSKKNRKKNNIVIDEAKGQTKEKPQILEDKSEKIDLGKGFLTIPLIIAGITTILFYLLVFVLVK